MLALVARTEPSAARYDPSDQALIFTLERAMRQFVDRELRREFGACWIKFRTPPARLKSWKWRQRLAYKNGEPYYPVLDFADFPDLKEIALSRGHWEICFARILRDKNQFSAAMDRIYIMRKALAHSRHIIAEQRLILRCASSYILSLIQPHPYP